jgi:hypothetical protein
MKIKSLLGILLTTLLLQYCSSTGSVEKPDNLIKESVMENMYTYNPKNPDFEAVLGKPYLYIKYGIDSLQLVESESYYSKFPRTYFRMHNNVLERLTKIQDSINEVIDKEKASQ